MNSWHILCLFALTILTTYQSAALNCAQCNVRFLGVQNLCHEPRNATGCIGCMKTVAKVKLRDSGYMDGWERMSVVISRFCITAGNINVKPAGCYKQQNNGGYTERCYCYTDNCNSRATPSLLSHSSVTAVFLVVFTFILVKLGN